MASASASTVSVQKSISTAASASSDKNSELRRKSCDTVCSSNSSCYLRKRKPVNPLAASVRYGTKVNPNAVKQRVMSAKLIKLRSIQSQLNDANFHLVELAKENRALKTLQRRQDKALLNYEGVNAELPRLIKAHEEEIRVLQEKNRAFKKQLKEASEQLKLKDEELAHVKEQLRKLSNLAKDRHLPEREKLAEQVEELKENLNKSESQITMLNRKLILETKNAKYKLNCETQKFKQAQKDLSHALSEIDRLNQQIDGKGKFMPMNNRKRFLNTNSISLVALNSSNSSTNLQSRSGSTSDVKDASNDTKSEESNSELKLEPISSASTGSLKDETEIKDPIRDILKSPADNIKARLSSNLRKYKSIDIEENKPLLGTLNLSETDLLEYKSNKSIYTVTSQITQKSRPLSSQKLEKLADTLEKVCNNDDEDLDPNLGDYCSHVMTSVRNHNAAVDKHKEDLETSKVATDTILGKLKETDIMDKKLRTNKSLKKDDFEIPEKDLDLVNQIWKDEYAFQKTIGKYTNNIKKFERKDNSTDKNGNVTDIDKEPGVLVEDKKKLLAAFKAIDSGESVEAEGDVRLENKRKLLATLRAIDNGEEVNPLSDKNSTARRFNIMNELFGNI